MFVVGERFDFSYMGESVQVKVERCTAAKVHVELLSGSNAGVVRVLTRRQAEWSLIPVAG